MIAELAWIAEIGDLPAIQIILGHALLGESLEFIGIAGGLCAEQAVAPDLFGRPAVVDFVKLVPAAELARQTVPQQLEQLDAFLGLVAVRTSQILIEIGPNFRILEIKRVAVEIDETRGDGLLDQVFDPRVTLPGDYLIFVACVHVRQDKVATMAYTRVQYLIEQTVASGLIYLNSHALDFKNPEIRPYLDQYLRGSNGYKA